MDRHDTLNRIIGFRNAIEADTVRVFQAITDDVDTEDLALIADVLEDISDQVVNLLEEISDQGHSVKVMALLLAMEDRTSIESIHLLKQHYLRDSRVLIYL